MNNFHKTLRILNEKYKPLQKEYTKKPFKDRRFFLCYNCGWGEKGIQEYDLSFTQMKKIISSMYYKDKADDWAESEDDYFELPNDRYVLDQFSFNESDWKGSDDW